MFVERSRLRYKQAMSTVSRLTALMRSSIIDVLLYSMYAGSVSGL